MKIDELISELEEIKKKEGNLNICICAEFLGETTEQSFGTHCFRIVVHSLPWEININKCIIYAYGP